MVELVGFQNVGGMLGPGVYALAYKGAVVYVGKSTHLLRRLYEHRNAYNRSRKGLRRHPYSTAKAILFDDMHVRPCLLAELDALERQMIELYKPKGNTKLKTVEKITTPISIRVNGVALSLNKAKPVAKPMERRV